ncbi:MAG: hypothetical protein HY709_08195 [Candidatus Latescibacteria bacterium]|nr:hypothetical protein [Candidatus Latescibacterota bacterium]
MTKRILLYVTALCSVGGIITGCAGSSATRGGGEQPPPIPVGMGQVVLDAGGISLLNYRIVDQATGKEVVVEQGRGRRAMSTRAVERGTEASNLQQFIQPGTYKVLVETDLAQDDEVEIDDVQVNLGETRYIPVPIGQFNLIVTSSADDPSSAGAQLQFPFKIWDYNKRTLLGRGMTSTQVKYFVAREGLYKVSVEPSPGSNIGELIQEVRVQAGRVFPVRIELPSSGGAPGGAGTTTPGQ